MSGVPAVSVVLTTFNQGRWLRQAIESVLAQTFRGWELLVVDNGSTDETPHVVAAYAGHPQITSIRYDQNNNHTSISNAAIRRARGQYIGILHGDDYYRPRKLERQMAMFDQLSPEYGVVYCGGQRLMLDGRLLDVPCASHTGNILEPLLEYAPGQLFQPIAPLIRRDCLLRYPFNESLFIEGEAIFGKIALGYYFAPVPEALVVMRDHETNLGKEIRSNIDRNVLLLDELFEHPEFPVRLLHHRARLVAETFRLGGWQAIRRDRDYASGREWLLTAITHDPSMARNLRVRTGLALCRLPRWLANACQRVLNYWKGIPPPGIGNPTPVTGVVRQAGRTAT